MGKEKQMGKVLVLVVPKSLKRRLATYENNLKQLEAVLGEISLADSARQSVINHMNSTREEIESIKKAQGTLCLKWVWPVHQIYQVRDLPPGLDSALSLQKAVESLIWVPDQINSTFSAYLGPGAFIAFWEENFDPPPPLRLLAGFLAERRNGLIAQNLINWLRPYYNGGWTEQEVGEQIRNLLQGNECCIPVAVLSPRAFFSHEQWEAMKR